MEVWLSVVENKKWLGSVLSVKRERQLVGRKQLQNERAGAHLQVEEVLTHGAAGREGTERFDLGFDLGNLR